MSDVPRSLVQTLAAARRAHTFPSEIRPMAQRFADKLLATLFPHFSERVPCDVREVEEELLEVRDALARLHRKLSFVHGELAADLPDRFLGELEKLHALMQ